MRKIFLIVMIGLFSNCFAPSGFQIDFGEITRAMRNDVIASTGTMCQQGVYMSIGIGGAILAYKGIRQIFDMNQTSSHIFIKESKKNGSPVNGVIKRGITKKEKNTYNNTCNNAYVCNMEKPDNKMRILTGLGQAACGIVATVLSLELLKKSCTLLIE